MSLPTYTATHHSSHYPAISLTLPSLSTTGKNILITGAGSGLGRALAFSFAVSGAEGIALLGRSESSLNVTAAEVKAKFPGMKVLVFVADIASEVDIGAAFEKAKQLWGGIDILIQNAAYLPDIIPSTSDAFSVSEWKLGLDINVVGNLNLARAFLRSTTSKEKVIIHITTAGAHLPAVFPGMGAYIASKIAALKMMEYVAAENTGVRVMFVHPGILNTEGAKKATEGGFSPMPNDDIELPANFIVWLTSLDAAFLQVLIPQDCYGEDTYTLLKRINVLGPIHVIYILHRLTTRIVYYSRQQGKLVWANWDVDELKAKKDKLVGSPQLTVALIGWPAA